MTTTFRTRIPTLSDAELRRYVEHPLDYRIEAVEAALAELGRRGEPIDEAALQQLRGGLRQREAKAAPGSWPGRLLGTAPTLRAKRIRAITGAILAAGLGTALGIYLATGPKAANPLGYEPLDTKKYLHDLELYGGKVNVLATEFMRWWDGLWHGRMLAYTVTWLTIALALAFWFVATRLATPLDPMAAEGEDGDRTDS